MERFKGDGNHPGNVALSRFRGSAPPVPPRELARDTEYGMRRPKGDEKRPDSVTLALFRGNVGSELPRSHARATDCAPKVSSPERFVTVRSHYRVTPPLNFTCR